MKRVLLSILFVTSLLGVAQADTIGYAKAISILAKSCGQDIERYCANAQLANFGINKCLEENAGNLTAQCNQDRTMVRQEIQARIEAQATALKVCQRDAAQYCPTITRGRGYTLQCLLKAERVVGKKCNQAITDAGWR